MTPTAIELWNDKKFLWKRFYEQSEYLAKLERRKFKLSSSRYYELRESAMYIIENVQDRLKELSHYIALDDVSSDSNRDTHCSKVFDQTIKNRLEKNDKIIYIQSRLHEADEKGETSKELK